MCFNLIKFGFKFKFKFKTKFRKAFLFCKYLKEAGE
jgi:hypothetical protein